jgi:hypothetical protein
VGDGAYCGGVCSRLVDCVYGKRECLCVEFEGSINTYIVLSRARVTKTRPAGSACMYQTSRLVFINAKWHAISIQYLHVPRYNTARITQVISSLDLSLSPSHKAT